MKLNLIRFGSLHGRDVDGDPTAPIPPNTVMHNGETYVLHKSSSIRQSDEVISGLAVDLSNSAGASPQVISESILDLESQQKSTVCQVRVYNLSVSFH